MKEATREGGVHRKLERAAIAQPEMRRRRASIFQLYVLLASVAFVALAAAAHYIPYFGVDVTITRALQRYHAPAFVGLMRGLSWLGFAPQCYLLAAGAILALFVAGLRFEATMATFAASVALLGTLIKLVVRRPRPEADLVHVFWQLHTSGFPSGHVLMATAFGGFLGFLAYTLLRPSWWRNAIVVLIAILILLMAPSRIYLGHHWFSDTMGAYVLGSLWLALTIRMYRHWKHRGLQDQPLASE